MIGVMPDSDDDVTMPQKAIAPLKDAGHDLAVKSPSLMP